VEEKTVDRVVDAGQVSVRGFRWKARRSTIVAIAMSLVACTTAPPPAPQIDARPVQPAPIIIVQPVQPEPPPPVVVAPPEPPKVNEEAEEALAVLADLQKLALAGPDEQKRELAAATQVLARQKSDAARLKLGMLQSLPAGGGDDARALATLDPVLRQGNGPTRMVAAVLMVQLSERQRAVREEKRKVEDLQQKLDALKALERSLLGRERKPANSP
jgi:type IV secretory pathway VirB10-like protein